MKFGFSNSFFKEMKQRVKAVFREDEMLELLKDTGTAFSLRVLGSFLAFIFNVVIARSLGAEGAGIYFIAFSIIVISSVISRLGLDNALLRFISIHYSNGDWGRVIAVHSLGVRMVIISSIIVSTLIFLSSEWAAIVLFGKPDLTQPLRWMTLSILPFALVNVQAESLKAIRHIPAAMMMQGIWIPLGSLFTLIALVGIADVVSVAKAFSMATFATLLLSIYSWKRAMPAHSVSGMRLPFRELWATCKPLLLTAIMNRALTPWAPILLLGVWVSNEDVGTYGAATRISLLVSLILIAVNSAIVQVCRCLREGRLYCPRKDGEKSSLFVDSIS